MKLVFGDLTAKANAEQMYRKDKLREKHIAIAMRALEKAEELPAETAGVWNFPFAIQHLGLSVLREAANRVRKARGW